MATIGRFTVGPNGATGTIRTLTVNVNVKIVPNDTKTSTSAPDYRVFAGTAERGAAWSARSNGDEP